MSTPSTWFCSGCCCSEFCCVGDETAALLLSFGSGPTGLVAPGCWLLARLVNRRKLTAPPRITSCPIDEPAAACPTMGNIVFLLMLLLSSRDEVYNVLCLPWNINYAGCVAGAGKFPFFVCWTLTAVQAFELHLAKAEEKAAKGAQHPMTSLLLELTLNSTTHTVSPTHTHAQTPRRKMAPRERDRKRQANGGVQK